MPEAEDPIRFSDVLTTAAAVANYLGEADVSAGHMLAALQILQGTRKLEDLGRPLSPLVRRTAPGQVGGVEPSVKALAQAWAARLGSAAGAMSTDQVAKLLGELEALIARAD
jgi:hypothetical protein